MNSEANRFENMVRDYLAGKVDWQTVHQCAVQMEYENKAAFPAEVRRPLEELHMIFMADAEDAPQFRADRVEIEAALAELDRLRADIATLGREAVAQREVAKEREQEQSRRSKFLAKHEARRKR